MIIESTDIVKKPVISVIVITYNHEKYLRQCLDNIIAQEVDVPYEIIIGEDCSVDRTPEICKEYRSRYPEKIRLILNETNLGIIRNYQNVLKLCRGEYIAQIAGDDFWFDKYKLQNQINALEKHPESDLCYTNCYTCDSDGKINKTSLLNDVPITFAYHLFNTGYIAPCSWMYSRRVLEYMDLQDWFPDESLAVALDVLQHSKLIYISDSTSVYRVHQGSAAYQTDSRKIWKYQTGLVKMQLYYARKYGMPQELISKLMIQEYYSKCFYAIEAGDEKFIQEGIQFCKEHGIIMTWFVSACKEYVKYKQQYNQVCSSKAYRLGKALLKPFKWLRRK